MLGEADLARIAPQLREVPVERGRVVYEAGQRIDHACFPASGIVSMLSLMENGDSVEVGAVGSEGMVAVACTLGDRISLSRAVVQVSGSVQLLPVAALRDLWNDSMDFRAALTRYNHAFAALGYQSTACNAVHRADMRLARWILEFLDRSPGGRTVEMTQEMLGQMLGVGRPTITVTAQTLQAAGLIRYARGVITVVDRPGLEAASCECYGKVRAAFDRLLPGSFPG